MRDNQRPAGTCSCCAGRESSNSSACSSSTRGDPQNTLAAATASGDSSCRRRLREHRQGSVARRLGVSTGLVLLVIGSSLACTVAAQPWPSPAFAPAPQSQDVSSAAQAGYEYAGAVQFVHRAKPVVPTMNALSFAQASPADVQREHFTVLVTSSGQSYTKKLATDPGDPELAEALAATSFSARRPVLPGAAGGKLPGGAAGGRLQASRRLAQAPPAQQSVGISSASTDLSCDGCSTYDNRVQVANTERFPFSAVGELTGQLGATATTGLECTGTLIGPRHVVTAAHCVFDINASRQYVSSLNFAPGQSGASTQPYGSVDWASVRVLSQFTSQPSYTPTAMDYDFALITLKSAANSAAGYLGMTVGTSSVTLNLTTAGYPGDKPQGTMWESMCANIQIDYNGNQGVFTEIDQCQNQGCANILEHTCLSSNGQSGSSMWDASLGIRAILTGKVSTSDNQAINVATKVDAFVYNTIAQWYNEDAKAEGSNQTLPAAPSGQQPPPAQTGSSTFLGIRVDWSNPVFVAVVVALCCAGLVLLSGLLFCLTRACGRPSTKVAYGQDVGASRQPPQRGASALPRQATPSAPEWGAVPMAGGGGYGGGYSGNRRAEQGVAYDERSGQFIVQGRPYGAYNFDAQRGYYDPRR